jgi:hypothetical protein
MPQPSDNVPAPLPEIGDPRRQSAGMQAQPQHVQGRHAQRCNSSDFTRRMYGESLSTALAVHLLREYSGIPVGRQPAHRGLSREKLLRATEYIQDQLDKDLTVAGIARTVPHESLSLYSTLQTGYRPITIPLCHRSKGEKSKRTIGIR